MTWGQGGGPDLAHAAGGALRSDRIQAQILVSRYWQVLDTSVRELLGGATAPVYER